MAAVPKSMLLCLHTTLMLGPLLPLAKAHMGPIAMGPPFSIIKAQLDLKAYDPNKTKELVLYNFS